MKSALKNGLSALESSFKDELAKYQKEYQRYRKLRDEESQSAVEELVKEVFLLRSELVRRDAGTEAKRDLIRGREILAQIRNRFEEPSQRNEPKQLSRNSSCSNLHPAGSTSPKAGDMPRRTGFESLKHRIKCEQQKLLNTLMDPEE